MDLLTKECAMQKDTKPALVDDLIDQYVSVLEQCLQDEDYIRDLAKRGTKKEQNNESAR